MEKVPKLQCLSNSPRAAGFPHFLRIIQDSRYQRSNNARELIKLFTREGYLLEPLFLGSSEPKVITNGLVCFTSLSGK